MHTRNTVVERGAWERTKAGSRAAVLPPLHAASPCTWERTKAGSRAAVLPPLHAASPCTLGSGKGARQRCRGFIHRNQIARVLHSFIHRGGSARKPAVRFAGGILTLSARAVCRPSSRRGECGCTRRRLRLPARRRRRRSLRRRRRRRRRRLRHRRHHPACLPSTTGAWPIKLNRAKQVKSHPRFISSPAPQASIRSLKVDCARPKQ